MTTRSWMSLPLVVAFLFSPVLSPAEASALGDPSPAFQIAVVVNLSSSNPLQILKSETRASALRTKTLPRLLRGEPPVYPERARKARIQGTFTVSGVITPEGRVEGLQLEGSPKEIRGFSMLQGSTFEAIRQWRFSPGKINDQAVPVSLRLVLRFELLDPNRKQPKKRTDQRMES